MSRPADESRDPSPAPQPARPRAEAGTPGARPRGGEPKRLDRARIAGGDGAAARDTAPREKAEAAGPEDPGPEALGPAAPPEGQLPQERRRWMGVLARAAPAALAAAFARAAPAPLPAHDWPRPPETGAVMVRGRLGGTGAPFSLGEMTLTRCTVALATGEVGHAQVQGHDADHARRAALVDALMQTPHAARIEAGILIPLARAIEEARARRAEEAERTRVAFETLVRGEG